MLPTSEASDEDELLLVESALEILQQLGSLERGLS